MVRLLHRHNHNVQESTLLSRIRYSHPRPTNQHPAIRLGTTHRGSIRLHPRPQSPLASSHPRRGTIHGVQLLSMAPGIPPKHSTHHWQDSLPAPPNLRLRPLPIRPRPRRAQARPRPVPLARPADPVLRLLPAPRPQTHARGLATTGPDPAPSRWVTPCHERVGEEHHLEPQALLGPDPFAGEQAGPLRVAAPGAGPRRRAVLSADCADRGCDSGLGVSPPDAAGRTGLGTRSRASRYYEHETTTKVPWEPRRTNIPQEKSGRK